MQYIDVDRLRAEIERRKKENMNVDLQRSMGRYYEDRDLLALLDSLLQEPAEWSEEDEKMLNSCISSIEESKENRYAYRENDGDTSYDMEIAWLKSLRSRPKSSDNWKPSEEQMEALEKTTYLANFGLGEDRRKALVSLYNQLKKL